MLLRICLIFTIVAGLATAYLGFFPVKDIITTTRQSRDDYHTKLTAETSLYQKTEAERKKTKKELDTTTAKLNDTQTQLEAANTKNTDLDKQNTDLTDRLTKTTARADADEQRLAVWQLLPPPEQIRGIIKDLAETKKARDAFVAENKVLLANYNTVNDELQRLVGTDVPVILPAGLRGKILAVDPKYDFVVLNIGNEQGAKERGEMMINRGGRLIGKIRISTVQKDRSVATVMPGWKRGDVMEGDQVIY